jgi:hypothetical protein
MSDWDDNDDNYEGFGFDSVDENDEFGEGFQIASVNHDFGHIDNRPTTGDYTGRNANSTFDYRDAAQESFEANLAAEQDSVSESELYGQATAETLLLGRGRKSAPETIYATQRFLLGQTNLGLSTIDAAVLREEFASEIEGDPRRWAELLGTVHADTLPGSITTINPENYVSAGLVETTDYSGNRKVERRPEKLQPAATGGSITGNLPASSKKASGAALSMLGESAGNFLDAGPGMSLPGNHPDKDKQAVADIELMEAIATIRDLSNLYISDTMKDAGGLPRAARQGHVHDALMNMALNGVYGDNAVSALPLPGELRTEDKSSIRGLRMTRPYGKDFNSKGGRTQGSMTGTPHLSRVDFDIYAQSQGWVDREGSIVEETSMQYWSSRPSPKNTLYSDLQAQDPMDHETTKRMRSYAYERDNARFLEARRVLREQMPTNRDESKRQIRNTGKDRPVDEQAQIQNLRNEAAILDLDRTQDLSTEFATLSDRKVSDMGTLSGSSRGGQYGEKDMSEVDVYVEQSIEGTLTDTEEDWAEFRELMAAERDSGIEQRTPEWYRRRKELDITASQLLKGKRLIKSDELAASLALKGLKSASGEKEFTGNYYTAEGQEGEAKAIRKFMETHGKGLYHEEVGLVENPKYPGFGASPDGRLITEEGDVDSLLEIKFLGNSTIDETEKYDWQMQMQMMVEEVDQTHFYAVNRDNLGDTRHRVVKADPAKQKQIRDLVSTAVAKSQGKSAKEVKAMLMKEEAGLPTGNAGPAESFTPKTSTDGQTMSYRDAIDAQMAGGGTDAEGSILGQMMHAADQRERKKAIEGGFSSVEDMNKFNEDAEAASKADKESAKAANEKAKADREAAKASKEFGKSVKNVASSLVGLATGANASGMDTVRAAAEAGMSADQARGIEFALVEDGGLTLQGARSAIAQAGQVQRQFNDVTQVAGAYTGMLTQWEGSGLSKVAGKMPSMQSIEAMSSQQYLEMVQNRINRTDDAELKSQIANVFGVNQMAASRATGDQVGQAGTISEEGLRAFYEGLKGTEQFAQTLTEEGVALSGFEGGVTTATTELALKTVGPASSLMNLAGDATTGVASAAATAALLKGKAAAAGIKGGATNLAKKAVANAKGGGLAALVPTAIRMGAGVEDDGGFADSAIDIAEFTAMGATIGSFVPGVGTVVGGAVGAAAGVGNELWEYFSSDGDNAVPDNKIQGSPQLSNPVHVDTTNNIDVQVTVDPNMIKTETNVNGEDYLDMETGHGT